LTHLGSLNAYAGAALLSLGMGIMNGTLSQVGSEPVNLTFVTGSLNKCGRHLALAFRAAPLPDAHGPWETHLRRAFLMAGLWGGFLIGAVVFSHVVTEEGVAYLYKAEGLEERRRALAAVAGVSPVGLKAIPAETAALRRKGVVAFPEDLGIHRLEAKRSLLAARSIEDLVAWSGGLYSPPAKFRNW